MTQIFKGYTTDIDSLKDISDERIVCLRFLLAERPDFYDSEKVGLQFNKEGEKLNTYNKILSEILKDKYCVGVEDCEEDLSGVNFSNYEGEEPNKFLRCECHDCGDPSCSGIGETYYLTGKEFKEILEKAKDYYSN